MLCLGIESTAHSFGVGIVNERGKILANVTSSSFKPEGIHPAEASEHHANFAVETIKAALSKAKIKSKNINLISFSQGPGLQPCLRIGAVAARTLAQKLSVPLIGVNHCVAHIEIGKLTTKCKDPIVIYLSGGNSQIIGLSGGVYRIFGETLDIAIGNMFDKFARSLDLGFPGGPVIDKLAEKGRYIDLPYIVKGTDFSFSGLLTSALQKAKTNKLEDVCFSLVHNSFAMLTEVTERALSHTSKKEVLLTGGVAASIPLKKMMEIMCKERKAKLYSVPKEYSGDNGAMIAWNGILEYKAGSKTKLEDSEIKPKWRTDEIEIKY